MEIWAQVRSTTRSVVSCVCGMAWCVRSSDSRVPSLRSVVPSLIGFGALGLFPSSPSVQLAALMAGFASVYAGDLTAASHRMVPRWYLKLRTPLTLIVLLSLGVSYAHLPPQP